MRLKNLKLTQNALIWLIPTTFLLLSGCSSVKELQVFSKAVERAPLSLQDPDPVRLDSVQWIVVTRDNFEAVFADLEKKGFDPVIIGLTSDGYETLSINTAQTRKYIILQKEVTKQYREYYEGKNGTEKVTNQ
jgi:hypothetical protein